MVINGGGAFAPLTTIGDLFQLNLDEEFDLKTIPKKVKLKSDLQLVKKPIHFDTTGTIYSDISKGIKIRKDIYKYRENLENHLKENQKIIDKMEKYINELMANGMTQELAQIMGKGYYNRLIGKMKLVRVANNKKWNTKKIVEITIDKSFVW